MPLLPSNFDPENIPAREGFDLLPPGDYRAMIVASEERQSKTGNPYIALTIAVVEGDAAGRKLWVNLNVSHPNPVAAAIAAQTLAEICRATGVLHPKRTEDLHDRPMIVTVRIKREKDGADRNEVTRFSSPSTAATTSPSTAATSVPPWRAKK